jgi:hypothetical protein
MVKKSLCVSLQYDKHSTTWLYLCNYKVIKVVSSADHSIDVNKPH